MAKKKNSDVFGLHYAGTHPEMIYLQNELQNRHDKRLELAAKKRKYDDDHVTLMRKVEEDAVWSWWKVCALMHTIHLGYI